MKYVPALLLAAVMACTAADIGFTASVGPTFPTGQWGRNLSTGIDARLMGEWLITPSLRAGAGVQGMLLGSTDGGSASLTIVTPQVSFAWFLRPWGRVFNPGIECAFGMGRSSLSNGDGHDPITWDPAWRAGLRWDFSMGGGFRGRVGLDYSSIIAEMEQADAFTLLFGFSTEVTI